MTQPNTHIRLLCIAARERHEEGLPHVLGAFNESFLNELPLEDYEDQILTLKETWCGDPSDYEFREFTVVVPEADIDSLFGVVDIVGRME